MLDKLREITGGDEKRMQLYIETYIEGMTEYLSELKDALEEQRFEDIGTIVHEAKPMFTDIGFDGLWKLANHVERGIYKRYSPEMMKEHTLDLIKDIQESLDQLKEFNF